jgi:hypothetical protein
MPTRIKFLALLILIALAVTPATAQQAENPLFQVHGEVNHEISNLKDEDVVRIPLTLQQGVTGVTPRLFSITLGKRSDQSLVQYFTPKMEETKEGASQVPIFLITINTKNLEQGTYSLNFDFTPAIAAPAATPAKRPTKKSAGEPAAATATKHQFLKVDLVLAEGTLTAPGTLVVEQVVNFWGWWSVADPKLALTEISGHKTRLNNVKIVQSVIPAGENEATDQRLTFETIDKIDPADTGLSAVKLSGPFPIGKNKGTALISSPQMKTPVALSFEVRSRLWRGYIVLVMFVGLVLGFLTRTWARQRIELQEAQLKAIAVAESLERELGARPDANFHAAVQPALDALKIVIRDGGDLTAAVTQANNALTAALNTLEGHRAVAQGSLNSLRRLKQLGASLPADFATTVQLDAQVLTGIASEIERNDVSTAAAHLEQVRAATGQAVSNVQPDWTNNVRTFYEQVQSLALLLPSIQSTAITAEINSAFDELSKLPPIDQNSSVDELLTTLTQVKNLNLRFNSILQRFTDLFGTAANTLQMQFSGKKPDPDAITDLLAKLDGIQNNLERWSNSPASKKDFDAAIEDGKSTWKVALLKQLEAKKEPVATAAVTTTELLNANEFWKAAMFVSHFLRQNAASKDPIFGDTPPNDAALEMDFAFTGGIPFLLQPERTDTVTIFSNIREKTLVPGLDSLRVQSIWELMWARRFRFLVSLILIIAFGYLLFAAKFEGTAMDLAAIFAWAFGTDITVDAAIQATQRVKGAG